MKQAKVESAEGSSLKHALQSWDGNGCRRDFAANSRWSRMLACSLPKAWSTVSAA